MSSCRICSCPAESTDRDDEAGAGEATVGAGGGADGVHRRGAHDGGAQGGAAGYIRKDAEPETLLAAIRAVARGRTYVDPDPRARRVAEDGVSPDDLTDREREVLRHLALGESNKVIADVLCVSEETVKTHVGHILVAKLEAWRNRAPGRHAGPEARPGLPGGDWVARDDRSDLHVPFAHEHRLAADLDARDVGAVEADCDVHPARAADLHALRAANAAGVTAATTPSCTR